MSFLCYYVREGIVTWAQKKTGVPVVRVNSETEAREFIKKHSLYAVGFFEKFDVCTLNSCLTPYKFLMGNF